MKFKKEDYPLLSGVLPQDNDRCLSEILSCYIEKSQFKILFPANSFVDAVYKNAGKMASLVSELKEGYYCIVSDSLYWMIGICEHGDKDGLINKWVKCWQIKGTVIQGVLEMDTCVGTHEYIISESFDHIKTEIEVLLSWALSTIILFEFAEVETHILTKVKPRIKLQSVKYLSEINQDITILDSKWFTTLIQSAEFKVRGHFAIRAHGEGRKERRLVWITEYKKDGYTRTAGILKKDE